MNRRSHFLLAAALTVLAWPLAAHAVDETADNGTLQAPNPIMHAEQDKAELCLEFDHALDTADRGGIAASLRLESEGKTIPVAAQAISVNDATLCVPSLEHRKEYRITVNGIHGAKDEKMRAPYSYSFLVPDRQPALAFSGSNDGSLRWQNTDPSLRAMNVARVHLELFRVSDMAAMVDAWRQRMQTSLAPLESASFAHDHGQSVWQNDLTLDNAPNKSQTPPVPLRASADAMPPGLYLIVATAVKTASKDGKKDASPDFMPVAAQWLLRSDLKIRAVRSTDGYYALSEKADASAPTVNTHITLQDHDQKILAEGHSDNDGIAALSLPDDKRGDAFIMVGQTDKGDIDFADLSPQDTLFILPDMDASVTADEAFYSPGSMANVAMTMHDAHGNAMTMKGSNLQILRPDAERSFYANIPVPDLHDGVTTLSVPVPAMNGLWPIVWQQSDGRVLAESKLRVTSNAAAPHLDAAADRAMVADDGDVNLTLKSLAQDHTPAPYITGRINAVWTSPDHLFPGWDEFHFGNSEMNPSAPSPILSFITDENGVAQLHMNLTPPPDGAPLHAVTLHIESDPVAGAADPLPLTLFVKPRDYIIGIKPAAAGGRFAENSLARFDVVGLDSEGNRRDVNDLTYQIFEEGRSFEWYQDEGRWNYKPQQQQRRVSGGALPVKAEGSSHIEWPVNAGNYRLDITNPSGNVVARLRFSAGWGLSKTDTTQNKMALNASQESLQVGQEAKIRFTLEQPAMVSAFIADDRIRKIIHEFKPAGDSQITFTPQDDWGQRVSLWVDTGLYGMAGQLVLPVAHGDAQAKDKPATPVATPSPIADFTINMAPPSIFKTGDTLAVSVMLKNNKAIAGSYHYSFSVTQGLKIDGGASGTLAIPVGQDKDIVLPVMAVSPGIHEVKLDITGPHNVHISQNLPLMVISNDKRVNIVTAQTIDARHNWVMPHDKAHAKPEAGLIFLSPAPMFNLPSILGAVLDAHPFTTVEIAGQLESMRLWRDVILSSGLIPEAMFEARRQDLLLRLLARQKSDGSFPAFSDQDSDLINSSAALIALAPLNLPSTKPAVEQIANWLHGRLSNTWFDEKERPERAKAYAALAIADRLDMSNLHYFSDTSAEKDLPQLADVQMAAAFAHKNDRDASLFWLNKAKIAKKSEEASSDISPQLLTLLSENPYFDPNDLIPALQKLSDDKAEDPAQGFGQRIAFLRALWNVTNRADAWRASINNAEKTMHGVLVVPVAEKTTILTVRNPMDRTLYLAEAHATPKPANAKLAITRHITRMNGAEIPDHETLDHDQIYLIVLEGPWVGEDDSFLAIHDDLTPAMHPIGCVLDAGMTVGDSMAWLKGLLLTTPTACEKSQQSIDTLLARDGKNKNAWRIAYFAKADSGGNFNPSPASARDIYGRQETLTGHADSLHIR